jgi:hypothetical protein
MVRISMADAHGREFYFPIPAFDAKAYRARKEVALEAIAEAIDAGLQPGRVYIRGDVHSL